MNQSRGPVFFLIFLILLLGINVTYLIHSEHIGTHADAGVAHSPLSSVSKNKPPYDFTSMLDIPSAALPNQTYQPKDSFISNSDRSHYQPKVAPLSYAPNLFASSLSVPSKGVFKSNNISYSAAIPTRYAAASADHTDAPVAVPANATTVKRNNSAVYPRGNYNRSAGEADNPVSFDSDKFSAKNSARSGLLSGYMPRQTLREQKALDEKLTRMASGIEHAVMQAMAPKSKRERNIEKYLPRRTESASMDAQPQAAAQGVLATPAEQINRQITSQAQSVVNDVRSSYGQEAAGRAGEIMDNFQKEMSSVLNAPGDPQEKAIRARSVNHKYNKQLQDLNRDESLKKMEMQFRTDNEMLLTKIREKFNPQTESAMRAKMEENLQKRMQIYSAGMSEEEAYKQLLALDEQQRKDLEHIVRQQNPSDPAASSKLVDLQNEEVKKHILESEQAVKEGRQTASRYVDTEDKRQARTQTFEREAADIIKNFEAFGPDVQAKAQQILKDMQQKQNENYASIEDINELNRKNMETTEQANQQLQALREQNIDQLTLHIQQQFNATNEQRLHQYTDMMKEAPEEAKEAWRQQAKPLLEKYNALRAQMIPTLKDKESYETAMRGLDEKEFAELQQIQISIPQPEQ